MNTAAVGTSWQSTPPTALRSHHDRHSREACPREGGERESTVLRDLALRSSSDQPDFVSGSVAGFEVYLDAFGAVLPAYAFGEIQTPQQAQHPDILPHDHGVEMSDAVLAGGVDQVPRQPDPEPPPLEPVLDKRRVLGPVGFFLPRVAHDGHYLTG